MHARVTTLEGTPGKRDDAKRHDVREHLLPAAPAAGRVRGFHPPRRCAQRQGARRGPVGERGGHAGQRGSGRSDARRVSARHRRADSGRGEVRSPRLRGVEIDRVVESSSQARQARALASPPFPHLHRDVGMVMIGLGVHARRTRGRGPSRSSPETILPIHSGQTPPRYGRKGIRGCF